MEIKKIQANLAGLFQKYKYVVLIIIAGIVLMMLPTEKDTADTPEQTVQSAPEKTLSEELEEILSLIKGAGKVQALLTLSAGEETVYQTDEDISSDDTSVTSKIKTVIVTTSEKAQTGLVKQINPPQYLGAVILCEGGDSPSVRLAIIDAVSKITGLGADKISVLKMK